MAEFSMNNNFPDGMVVRRRDKLVTKALVMVEAVYERHAEYFHEACIEAKTHIHKMFSKSDCGDVEDEFIIRMGLMTALGKWPFTCSTSSILRSLS